MYIEIDELKRIYARATDVQTDIKKLFNSVNDTLNELCENVRSTSLTSSTEKLKNALIAISSEVDNNTILVNEFLNQQVNKYSEINVDTKAEIDALTADINSNIG